MKASKAMKAIYGAIAVSALLATGVAGAQCPGMGMGPGGGMGPGFGPHTPPMERALGMGGIHGRWWNNPAMIEKLKLTDDQRKAMDAILLAHRERLVDLRANLEKSELQLQPMMSEDQPNESGILAQVDKIAAARTELERANARFLLDIRAKLTPDQWKTVRESWAERMQRRGMGPGGGRMMNPPAPPAAPPDPPAAPGPGAGSADH